MTSSKLKLTSLSVVSKTADTKFLLPVVVGGANEKEEVTSRGGVEPGNDGRWQGTTAVAAAPPIATNVLTTWLGISS